MKISFASPDDARPFHRGPAAVALAVLLVLSLEAPPARSIDRLEFSRLLQVIPPDEMPTRYGNVTLESVGQLPSVTFPHWLHRSRYTCNVCHVDLGFSMFRGETRVTRADNLAGRYCGACHNGKTAFGVSYAKTKQCDRCHATSPSALDERYREFAEGMPKASFGDRIDWVKAIEEGVIKPKRSFDEEEPRLELPKNLEKDLYLDVSSKRTGSEFSHRKHVAWIDCSGCHPELFTIKAEGTRYFSMEKNLYGWFCGTCHLRVSFPMRDCGRCHPYIKSNSTGPSF